MARSRKLQDRLWRPLSTRGKSRRPADEGSVNPDIELIWNVIAAIPRGMATTYGDVARAAGLPGRARLTGYALRHMDDDMHLPWHRVVGAGGRIVFPKSSAQHREQARLLKSEGVAVKDGRVARSALMTPDDFDRR